MKTPLPSAEPGPAPGPEGVVHAPLQEQLPDPRGGASRREENSSVLADRKLPPRARVQVSRHQHCAAGPKPAARNVVAHRLTGAAFVERAARRQ